MGKSQSRRDTVSRLLKILDEDDPEAERARRPMRSPVKPNPGSTRRCSHCQKLLKDCRCGDRN